ncbi:hypothetical protein L1049_009551 [Liquidambar formosana]|uniref:E3 ubiquitin-protein ligase LIN n=1 Tax=Liquidambar formosana TaxID=63359 RepID=A0AAP0R064_LIQFO
MASLQELLAQEGFEREKFTPNRKPVKFRDRFTPDESIALPIYICRGRNSFNISNKKNNKKKNTDKAIPGSGSSLFSSKRLGSDSERSNCKSIGTEVPQRDEPAIDEVAIKAVISILSGYVGRYLKDGNFREIIREKCYSCLERKKKDSDNGVFANMELGIESIEKLVEDQGTKKELRMKTLRNSIRLLSIVASLNSKNSKNGSTSGTPNSHLSACAQLYISIVYKLEKNDRISARHLLQVFCDAPFLARTYLLPDLWEHFFLPHLLHLKIWYSKELEFLSNLDGGEKEKKVKALSKVYNDQMDMGTAQFALYYKGWLKVGVKAPPVPSVPLPSRPSYPLSRRRSSDSVSSHCSPQRNLYRTVFGPSLERQSMDLNDRNRASIHRRGLEEEEKVCTHENKFSRTLAYVHSGMGAHRRSSDLNYRYSKAELLPETQKSDYFRFLNCRSEPTECLVNSNREARNGSIRKEEKTHPLSSDLSRAITTICSSDSLENCEIAIRVSAKAWLDSHGDPIVETALSKAPVIEGMVEVLFASNDDEILELTISVLAELVARSEENRQRILNSDPQLEIFTRLLRNSSLFLKAAVLLYLLKPKAKQMISMEWIPLVLRVLEFGDQLQTLLTVRCSPQVAAFYFLDQLLTGFNEDRNLENARHVVSLGGLSLLVRRLEKGDTHERNNAASIIYRCIRADGSCRNYIASNLNKSSVLELLVLGNQKKSNGSALSLLTELLCINRRTQISKFLNGLINGGSNLNTMHILLIYLQKAPPEERPLVAAILLQLDLLGDPLKCSVYRDEVVDEIIAGLECQVRNENIQKQSARALLMLGGHFSYAGEASVEKWILRQAGFDDSSGDSYTSGDIVGDEYMKLNEEEEAADDWQRKAAIVLLTRGNKRLLAALSDSIANSIPSLARASLITVSWMSSFLPSIPDENFRSLACSILVPQLLQSLKYDRDLEERVLASYSLLSLIKSSDCSSTLSPLDEELVSLLRNLSLVTWTATELISIITNSSRHWYPELEDIPA